MALTKPDAEQAVALMEWQLLRRAVTKTTLTAFNLDEGAAPELRKKAEQVDTLARDLEVAR